MTEQFSIFPSNINRIIIEFWQTIMYIVCPGFAFPFSEIETVHAVLTSGKTSIAVRERVLECIGIVKTVGLGGCGGANRTG